MSDKRFSQDFTQKTGDTPLTYRMLVEDPTTGNEYWVTNEQAQAILKGELTAESLARSQAITAEQQTRAAAITSEANTRIAADNALAASVEMALVLAL